MATQHPSSREDIPPPVLRLRITHITSTMSTPLASLAEHYAPSHLATSIPLGSIPVHMPVLRIFGTTPALQKVCANIHLCYPYFFVPFPMDSTDPLRPERVVKLCQRFAVSLNHAICLALRQSPTSLSSNAKYGGGTDPRHLHVASVMLVKGTPFYGYHIGHAYFLKVSLVNPSRLYVALEQLRKPAVLGREWQPHEAHMNHVLQFMCDFDLYGCGWLELGGGTFRDPLPAGDPYDERSHSTGIPDIYNDLTVPDDMLYSSGLSPPKDTYTPLEIDVLPHHILNRRRLRPRALHQDFVELLHQPLDPEEKLVPAVAELWEDERRRRSIKGLSLSETAMMPGSGGMGGRTMAELGYKVEGKSRAQNRGGDWKISDELWEMIESRMSDERRKKGRLTFERFSGDIRSGRDGEKRKYDRWIMTTFEAVSAHWPKGTRPPRNTPRKKKVEASNHARTPSTVMPTSPTFAIGDYHATDYDPANALSRADSLELKPDITAADAHRAAADYRDDANGGVQVDYEEEEQDPFELYAMTQASQGEKVPPVVEVNARLIQRDVVEEEEDGEDAEQQRHQADVRQHADEGIRFRATQAPKPAVGSQASSDYGDFDDQAMDELFRRTVAGGLASGSTTPVSTPRKRPFGTITPATTASSRSGGSGGWESRRRVREERMRERAGLGDLSIIMDQSSMSLTSDRGGPRTPVKPHTPISDRATLTPLARNVFSRSRPLAGSPLKTSRKNAESAEGSTIVLPQSRRSLGRLSYSPEHEEDEREATPTPIVMPANGYKEILAVKAEPKAETDVFRSASTVEHDLPPAQQTFVSASTASTISAEPGILHLPSPTYISESMKQAAQDLVADLQPKDLEISSAAGIISQSTPEELMSSGGPKRKRVRLASPVSKVARMSQQRTQSQPSQKSGTSAPTTETNGSSSDLSGLSKRSWQPRKPPPIAQDVIASFASLGLPTIVYQEPYYSNPVDVPGRAKMFAGRIFNLKGNGLNDLQEFGHEVPVSGTWLKGKRSDLGKARYGWEFARPPPDRQTVADWCKTIDEAAGARAEKQAKLTSQLAGPTQKNRYGFKFSQNKKTRASEREQQNMSVLALEVFAKSRHQLLPDPEKDEVTAVFFCYQNEDETLPDTTIHRNYYAGYVVVEPNEQWRQRLRLEEVPCTIVDTELDLINWVVDLVKGWDPDVLAGWELHNGSWGYLASRAQEAFSIDLTEQLSRVVSGHSGPKKDFYSATHTSTFKVSGRHILNIWRICRSEITLTQYTFENVVFHVLHQRIPHYHPSSLTALWKSATPSHTQRVLKYFFQRVVLYMEVVDHAEIITKNAEFARVFGVDFASVMFRGSQYKVESFMFRIAKPESFVLVSPSKQQVGLQNAPFAVPLIAEPESKYYNHPILVLDFQSLYPSVMIAYNICFSTCLGRVEKFKGTDKFGFTELKVADGLMELLKDYLTVTPNGMIFVKPAVRKSLLAKMLGEILDTRVMVKHAMKAARDDKSLLSLLNARQLGLKLMANVTYGYTSATYSGRMPCIEVADSIVQTGRETLEKAQELIQSRADWDAQVVYGDTDSLFVALPGRSKEQAFVIGNAIADTVTAMNPKPVKLKFEKVYMGSVLMAKKRYVGLKYEHPDEKEPVFDAKGIETIRRDGFPAQQKIEEVCLKMLFRSQDLSEIKDFCRQEWTKILQGRVSPQNFIVAKEVRLGSYSEKGVPPPGAAVAYRRILKDPRDEPQYAERVPYIVSNAEGRRLIDRARTPEEMLANRSLGIDAEYYIRNLLIPPLSRIFNLVGADVEHWYDSMPRTKRAGKYDTEQHKMRIDSHFRSSHCMVCGQESSESVCDACRLSPSTTAHALASRQHLAQEKLKFFHTICASCSGTPLHERILCDSIDCPITYARTQALRDAEDMTEVGTLLQQLEVVGEIAETAGGDMDW